MATHDQPRIVRYNRLNGKYLKDADELFKKKDYSQASEKYWGAAAESTKAYAESIGKHLKTHADLWDFVIGLNKKEPELNLVHLFADANHLHSNFYEDDLRPEVVEELAKSVKKYVQTIKGLQV
jgi:hypothetical protein